MTTTESTVRRGANLSEDGRYRYSLWRRWDGDDPRQACFVMLNPSTADALVDDPTIRRCIGFAKSWGLSGIRVVNLYAMRTTRPVHLWEAEDPVGPENDEWIFTTGEMAMTFDYPVIAAWGANAKPDRVARVVEILTKSVDIFALGVTKAGQPRHPLYLPGNAPLNRWAA